MKNNLHVNPILFKMILLVTCFMLAILYNKTRAAALPGSLLKSADPAIHLKHDLKKHS